MTYLIENRIASSGIMWARIAQAVVGAGYNGNADQWVYDNRRRWASTPAWVTAWVAAVAAHPPPPPPPGPPGPPPVSTYDPAEDDAVITDAMILARVLVLLP
jgi:hypothetical protein